MAQKDLSLQDAIAMVNDRVSRMEKLEGRSWGPEGTFIELSKQVGQLAKLIMTYQKYYHLSDEKLSEKFRSAIIEEIGDELADIAYVIFRMAREYKIDFVKSFINARQMEDDFIRTKGF